MITAFGELSLSGSSAPPDRPDRVADVGGRQTIPVGEPRLPWWTAAQSTAFGKKLRSRSPMDRAIDSTAAEPRGVRGIDDRIDLQRVMSPEEKRMRAAISGKTVMVERQLRVKKIPIRLHRISGDAAGG